MMAGKDSQVPRYALGCVNRAFGDTFSYLDFEWLNDGSDFQTVYTPAGVVLPTPPEGLQTETLIATTGCMDGMEWDTYNTTVTMGFDGDDVWLQGLYDMMPQTWLKGHRDGKTITFSTGQPLGSYLNKPAYLIGAKSDSEGNPVISDIVFTYDAANHTFAATSAVIAIGINKTGLLGLQNMYNATFTPDKAAGIETVCDPTASGQHPVYDLQGRRIDARHATSNKGILISNGKKVVLR